MKKPRSYVVLAILASGALYLAISLGALVRKEHTAMGPPAAAPARASRPDGG